MKFLIQTVNDEIIHDFSFQLKEAIRYRNWYYNSNIDMIEYTNSVTPEYKEGYCPIGSVEFVSYYLEKYFNKQLKPINVPESLYKYANRRIVVGNEDSYVGDGSVFAKSHDKIKRFADIINPGYILDPGEYQFSGVIDIESEWRCFVYNKELVGLQNYSGDFTLFPDVSVIKEMINDYNNQPVAYTLDVGVVGATTFIIEVHDFFSCCLYGFCDNRILPLMFYRWFYNFVNERRINAK